MIRRTLAVLGAVLLSVGTLGLQTRAAEVISGSTYYFCAADFAEEEALAGICITALPEGSAGAVMLGARVLQPGDILTADQVADMTFCPVRTETDTAVQVGYLPVFADRVEQEALMTISIRGKEDKAPVAEDMALETYKNMPNTGRLKVQDPEGEAMTYTVIRKPRRGTVEIAPDGTFTYTPKKNKVGVDTFVYTAADPAGNVSREATVTVTVLKPTAGEPYADTEGKDCRFAAEWMKNTGIFVGETLAGDPCFSPDREVTRGEFVAMLVKALDIPAEEDLAPAGYTDEIPQWLQPYLMAAMRSGLTAGLPEQQTFGADTAITGAEAAVMLQNALDLTGVRTSAQGDNSLPAWARSAMAAVAAEDICLEAGETVTRGEAAQVLYRAAKLAAEPTLEWNVAE